MRDYLSGRRQDVVNTSGSVIGTYFVIVGTARNHTGTTVTENTSSTHTMITRIVNAEGEGTLDQNTGT